MTDMDAESASLQKVFLCHSSGDRPAVRELYERLRADGFDPWLDAEKLLAGQDWQLEIRRAIRQSDFVLVCLSRDAVEKFSYVQREVASVLDRAAEAPEGRIFIIPVRLEECEVPDRLSAWHFVDFFADDGYERLLRALGRQNAATPQPSGAFWFAGRGILLALLILLVAHLPGLAGKPKLYAMSVSLVAGLIITLGPASRLQKLVWTTLRRIYQRTLSYPVIATLLMWLVLILAVSGVGVITWILGVRMRYSGMILRALELEAVLDKKAIDEREDLIRRAFVLLPDRKEAQILMERRTYRLRNSELQTQLRQQYVRSFLFQPDIVRAIEKAQAGENGLLKLVSSQQAIKAFNNPVIWYASLFFEALDEKNLDEKNIDESIDLLTRALALLSTQKGIEAEIYRALFQVNMDQLINKKNKDEQLADSLFNKIGLSMLRLREVVDRPSAYAEMAGLHVYQVACDTLATYALIMCDRDNMTKQSDEATHFYRLLLRAREQVIRTTGEPIWQRPPEKIRLYHLFLSNVSRNDVPAMESQKLLDSCPEFKQRFREQFMEKESFFKNPNAWFKGTVQDESTVSYLRNELLNKDWRY